MDILLNMKVDGAFVNVFHEDHEPDFDYGDAEENQKEMQRFESGELMHVMIEVIVFDKSRNVKGRDILGGVFTTASNLENNVEETIKEYDMIQNAKENLNQKLKEIKEANA